MPSRNSILIVGLALFLVWYVSAWAYQTLYLEPRKELGDKINELSSQIVTRRNSLNAMTQFNTQNAGFYWRTLPSSRNEAQSQYSFWLLELLLYSGFENNHVNPSAPVQVPSGASFQFNVQCTGTLAQISYFLFEFYHAPFLHRLTTMTLAPAEGNPEQLTFSMVINALALNTYPYQPPLGNQMPTGYISRLAFSEFAMYQVIANRNLLQTAKGGIDLADYTFLSAILDRNNQTEVWFSVRTNDSTIKAKLGDLIQSGSFSGRLVEILDQDIVLDRNGERWLLANGESLNQAFALPPETAGNNGGNR